jgi:diacylglycerol kinase (ATP)
MSTLVEIVVAPGSGDGRAHATAQRLRDVLTARGHRSRVHTFPRLADLHRWARNSLLKASHLVCVGGDATVSAAAAAAARLGVPFIPVPSGFGNVFARAFGHDDQPQTIADLIDHGEQQWIDVGVVRHELFLCHQSYGFLEDVQNGVERRWRPRSRWRRLFAYYMMANDMLRQMPLARIQVDVDGTRVTDDGVVVTVANVETYRGFLTLTPAASPLDGLFDICVIPHTTKLRLILQLLRLALKLPGCWTGVRLLHARRVSVRVARHAPDELRLWCAALPLVVPAGSVAALERRRAAVMAPGQPRAA